RGTSMTEPLIQTKELSVRHGLVTVLDGINFSLAPGEIVTIVGPNGSGKSTFLRALLGSIAPSSGQILRRPGPTLGYVPQRLVPDAALPITVARFLGLPRRISPAKARAALERAGVPDIAARAMADLSGGQFQRVLLARALITKPDLLMLDEGAANLDQPGAASF